ncbi:MAG: 1-deoxy-D-xylulose-5-phosphate reductoisomerase [Muribaculaceae bacterium]|nr:1-deoxy-D-xylulose-5-phosphate reductoisomerase [Muribaculaceae bacterium]
MAPHKKIALLGSTGSIGTQTLDIIAEYPDLFSVEVLIAGSNIDLLIQQALKFKPKYAIIANDSLYSQLSNALAPLGINVAAGKKAICEAMALDSIDVVVTAAVGYSGLEPTISAIKAGKRIALANKETLVVAGELVTSLLKDSASTIIPVDSEHSAIYQCLVGEDAKSIKKLIITASGGPFRNKTLTELKHVTVADALKHPNWSMGAKITIDSATMLNKAFEIIEARWLFGIEAEKIEAVVHPQSIIHSMVEFVDNSVKAQLGLPDMHLPIRYALGDATRLATTAPALTLADYATLTFEKPDTEKFPCLNLAYEALKSKGNTACIINAANEIAVAAFLKQQISFLDIYKIIEKSIANISFINSPTFEDYVNTNTETRAYAASIIK